MSDLEIEKLFSYQHLPEDLQEVSKPFCELAKEMREKLNNVSSQKNVCLQKLLEAKDAAVRASIKVE